MKRLRLYQNYGRRARRPKRLVSVQLQWEPRDLWIGAFYRKTTLAVHVYICIVPTVPLHITIERNRPR